VTVQNLPVKPSEPTMDIDDNDLSVEDQPVLQPPPTKRPAPSTVAAAVVPNTRTPSVEEIDADEESVTVIDYAE